MSILVAYTPDGEIISFFDSEINTNIPGDALELTDAESQELFLQPDAWMVDAGNLKLIRKPATVTRPDILDEIPAPLPTNAKYNYSGLAAAVRNTPTFGKAFQKSMENVAINGALTFFMAALNPAVFVKDDLYAALRMLLFLMHNIWDAADLEVIDLALISNGFDGLEALRDE